MRAERIALLAAWSLAAGTAHAAIEAETQPARQFGYTIGDVIHQTVRLSPGAGQTLIEESLPKPGRAGAWVERRDVEAVRAGSEWRIELRYQFINSPPDLRTVALPALRVQLRDGDRIVDEVLAEAPLTVAPLTPTVVLARAGLEEMRPDTPPPLIDVQPRRQRIALYGGIAGLIGLLWAGWYFGVDLRGRRTRPFARAERTLRRQLAKDRSPDAMRDGMRTLHRAFDATAGSTLFAQALDDFFDKRPALAPAREAVSQFFAASRNEFFGTPAQDGDAREGSFEAANLLALARRLKALEREMA
ncbi:MAG TPA: hypothetical protein PLX20_10645 [Rhodocyclaceae bacterium]|nr:hypothetical protein [Rhodocyclaceae bacterium]HNH13585.1 hypothetical protein [Rhodocyclaceae bacterium]